MGFQRSLLNAKNCVKNCVCIYVCIHICVCVCMYIYIYIYFPNGLEGRDSVYSAGHLEKGMATHSSILAWRIPWMKKPGGLQSMGLQIVRHY